MGTERLDRVLSHLGQGSRREVKLLVRQGRVMVDGVPAGDPGQLVDPAVQQIAVDGTLLSYQRHFHLMLHKPGGVITATQDPRQKTVMDILPPDLRRPDLVPVGRLDRDTEGLLLFTTDGELCHRLLSPRWHVAKRYFVRLDLPVTPEDRSAFAEGILLEDGTQCLPAALEFQAEPCEAVVTLHEGKYHQVKRMFQARGKRVLYLKRLSMGPLLLGDLPLGAVRPLTQQEVAALYRTTGLAQAEGV